MAFKFSSVGTVSCPLFDTGHVVFDFANVKLNSQDLKWTADGDYYQTSEHNIELRVDNSDGTLAFRLVNVSEKDIMLDHVTIEFAPKLAADDFLEFIHPFYFDLVPTVKKLGLANNQMPGNPGSSLLYVLFDRQSKQSALFGTLGPHQGDHVRFKALHDRAHQQGLFGLEIDFEIKCRIQPGSELELSRIMTESSDDAFALMESFGKRWSGLRELKKRAGGWNSWDYYRGSVCAEDIYENQQIMCEKYPGQARYMVIDEGWECRWGEWYSNFRFPADLREFANKVEKNGSVPGIWTAPLMHSVYTKFFREHPQCFIRDESGQIAMQNYSYGKMALLDPTHPESETFLRELYSRLRDCGFEYFKVDFTAPAILYGEVFHDKTLPRGGILRRLFTIIRESISEESYLLACGAPFESVTGIVDAVRSACDIHNFWSHVLYSAGHLSGRWWMHRQMWNCDPDFLIVRGDDTADDFQHNPPYMPEKPFSAAFRECSGRQFNYSEAECYTLLNYLSAGDVFLSDNLAKLNDKGWSLLYRFFALPRLEKAARPLDLFQSHDALPSVWLAREKDFAMLGLFNWTEDPMQLKFDLQKYSLDVERVIFGPADYKIEAGILKVCLEPRSCLGLQLK